jgi:hypothetical protein
MPEHIPNCLHSEDPEVIIQGKARFVDNLYWKRCDGTFKNIRGVELVVIGEEEDGSDGEAAQA